jgi:Sugar (and other) transporter
MGCLTAMVAYFNCIYICIYVATDLPSPSPYLISLSLHLFHSFTSSRKESDNCTVLAKASHANSNKAQTDHHEEKAIFNNVETVNYKAAQGKVKEVNAASVALAAAIAAQKPSLLSKNMLKLYFIMSVGYLVSAMNGFGSSLMGAINAMTPYQESFGLSGAGEYLCWGCQTTTSSYRFFHWNRLYNLQSGSDCCFPILWTAGGRLRTKDLHFRGMSHRTGTAVQGSCHALSVFMGGRFILGFGAALASAAEPACTVELAPPHYRGTMAGLYNTFW